MTALISGLAHASDHGGTLPTEPGLHDVAFALSGARTGRATISIPARGSASTRAPLVLVLHYAGEPTPWYGRPLLEELIEPSMRSLGAVFVAPETLGGPWHSEANEAWVMALLDEVGGHYDIDPGRVVITGYSMGAMGTWHFIAHHPERFAAAIPISGFPNLELSCALPVYALHAPSDELFPFERLAERVDAMQARGCAIRLEKVDAQGHFDLQGFRSALQHVPSWLQNVWPEPAE